MKRIAPIGACVTTMLVLASCTSGATEPAVVPDDTVTHATPAYAPADPGALEGDPDPEAPREGPPFDPSQQAVSSEILEDFPYIPTDAPEGVRVAEGETLPVAEVPVWNGTSLVTVTGMVYTQTVDTSDASRWSAEQTRQRVHDYVTARGGALVTRSYLSEEALDTLAASEAADDLILGLGDVYNRPVATYLIRTAGYSVWLQMVSNSDNTSLLVVQQGAE